MTLRTPTQAVIQIQQEIHVRTDIGTGMCLENAHAIYGIGAKYASALLAWQGAQYRHIDLSTAPIGAFVFMDGGHTMVQGKPAGHVMIYAGNGKVYTPGGPVDQNHWYLTTIADIERLWPWHHYIGWTEDVNGVRVPGLAPIAKSVPAPPKVTSVDQQTALNIQNGKPVSQVKRPKVAQRMREIISRLLHGEL